ncbi:putative reverse transcriptase domain-containing protein [Tanacetum coccineum]
MSIATSALAEAYVLRKHHQEKMKKTTITTKDSVLDDDDDRVSSTTGCFPTLFKKVHPSNVAVSDSTLHSLQDYVKELKFALHQVSFTVPLFTRGLFRPTGDPIAYDSKEELIEEEPLEEPNEEGYYRRFIANSSKVAKPLASLTQKIRKYEWVKEQEEAFQTLKDNLCDTPILSLPDGSKEFVVYCDASNQGLGCVLMQRGKVENATAEMLRGLDQLMERKEGGGMYLLWVSLIGDVRTLMIDEAHASRSHVLWAEIREIRSIGPELVQETTDKVIVIRDRLKAARDCQKSYVGNMRKPLEFQVGDHVMLKVSPWKGVVRFGKKGKLAPRFVGPFEILERIGPMAYRLRLPEELSSVC